MHSLGCKLLLLPLLLLLVVVLLLLVLPLLLLVLLLLLLQVYVQAIQPGMAADESKMVRVSGCHVTPWAQSSSGGVRFDWLCFSSMVISAALLRMHAVCQGEQCSQFPGHII
jgi:hypothetical protein